MTAKKATATWTSKLIAGGGRMPVRAEAAEVSMLRKEEGERLPFCFSVTM